MNAIAAVERAAVPAGECGERIRVHGLVQGVGFRPTVWRIAQRLGLRGAVWNDGEGLAIHVGGAPAAIEAFVRALGDEAPPLARVERIERERSALPPAEAGFAIAASSVTATGRARTGVGADTATCADCLTEVFDPFARRFRYPFANCTHCGPRLSIAEAIPYDRATTTMRGFAMCAACAAEYADPGDRRFHAQAIACHACGPRARLERMDGAALVVDTLTTLDAVDAVCTLLHRGEIVAIKGLGGYQLACDAGNETAVARLRERKRRERKPFALMVRDLTVARRWCAIDEAEAALLQSAAAPIVVLARHAEAAVAASVAPGLATLGLMLPNTPLHHLMLRRMDRPIVLTSGNLSDEPQCIADDAVRAQLGGLADWLLTHDRPIARRVDDSVQRVVAGAPRMLRRARGHAPAAIRLPAGFEAAAPLLALGGELKNAFCLLRDGEAIVSHHVGDLEDAATQADWQRAIAAYEALFEHAPQAIAVDRHPEYLSTKQGHELARRRGLELVEVQHHHAHVAACLAEHGVPLAARPVLGVVLDGLGWGEAGQLWGGEFLRADYRGFERLGTFKPVALPGGEQAMREPWRNTYAQLMAEMGWARFAMNFGELELCRFLDGKPRGTLDRMIAAGINSPKASSCGRLFDAAAAAAGVCRERALYEGQAAIEFEARVDAATLADEDEESAYPFAIPRLGGRGLSYIEPLAMWQALLGDLVLGTPVPVIAARFHKGLAIAIVAMVDKLQARADDDGAPLDTVVLSGGVFQNRVLLEQVNRRLSDRGLRVLVPQALPAHDGGLALGQAVIAAAQRLAGTAARNEETPLCA